MLTVNPYTVRNRLAAASQSVVPALETLAKEYWEVAKPVWDPVTVAHFADFRPHDGTFEAFVRLGQALTAEGLVKRVGESFEKKYACMGCRTMPWLEPTERQRALWAISQMVEAGVAEDRCRFDAALAAVMSDPDALPHLRPLFRQAGGVWTAWVYCERIEGFIERANAILLPRGLTVSDDILRHFHPLLSETAYHALATWAEWVNAPGEVRPMGFSEYGPPCGFPLFPNDVEEEVKQRVDLLPEAGEKPDDNAKPLTDRQEHILLEMLDMNAVGSRHKTNRDAVARRLGNDKTGADLGRDFAALAAAGFTESMTGPSGGLWLNVKGKAEAQRLLDKDEKS